MKYNPKVNEVAASLPGFAAIHPNQEEATVQGALRLIWELQVYLAEITGMPGSSLATLAGAHGELAGVLMVRAYHRANGEAQRKVVLIPDSAHGTNPASAAMAGFHVVTIPSDARGNMDLRALRRAGHPGDGRPDDHPAQHPGPLRPGRRGDLRHRAPGRRVGLR